MKKTESNVQKLTEKAILYMFAAIILMYNIPNFMGIFILNNLVTQGISIVFSFGTLMILSIIFVYSKKQNITKKQIRLVINLSSGLLILNFIVSVVMKSIKNFDILLILPTMLPILLITFLWFKINQKIK